MIIAEIFRICSSIQGSTAKNENCTVPHQIIIRRHEHKAPVQNAFKQDRSRKNFLAHCEERRRYAIVAVFEVNKEIPD